MWHPIMPPAILAMGRGWGLLSPGTTPAGTDSPSPALCSPEATAEGHRCCAKGRVTASLDPVASQQEEKVSLEALFPEPQRLHRGSWRSQHKIWHWPEKGQQQESQMGQAQEWGHWKAAAHLICPAEWRGASLAQHVMP